jgi:hypothetical protein
MPIPDLAGTGIVDTMLYGARRFSLPLSRRPTMAFTSSS